MEIFRKLGSLSMVLVLIVIFTSLTSCEKYRMNRDQAVARDQALAETSMFDLFYVADKFIRMEFDTIPPSPTTCPERNVTAIDGNYPKTLIINYSPDGCEDQFGTRRSGILEVVINGPYHESPTTATVNAVNYSVNGYEIDGTITIGQRVIQADGTHKLQVNTSELTVFKGNGDFVSLDGNYQFHWVEGMSSPSYPFDDVYLVNGNAAGTSGEDYDFISRTTEDLLFVFGCRWATEGVTEITPEDFKSRTIDYGNGRCDNAAKLEIGRRSYDLSLR